MINENTELLLFEVVKVLFSLYITGIFINVIFKSLFGFNFCRRRLRFNYYYRAKFTGTERGMLK